VWLSLDIIKKLVRFSKDIFSSVDYCYTTIPTYPGGQIGFLLCSAGKAKFRSPVKTLEQAMVVGSKLTHYTEALHAAAFVLPAFAQLDL
jgi:spermidine synthase